MTLLKAYGLYWIQDYHWRRKLQTITFFQFCLAWNMALNLDLTDLVLEIHVAAISRLEIIVMHSAWICP